MAAKKENHPPQNYRIKLLAGNNVVLVEADKYESEIFTPQIVNGRITFLNIIPNRRCCKVTKTNVMNYTNVSVEPRKYLKEQNVVKSGNSERLLGGQSCSLSAPLANSTPASVKKRNGHVSMLSYYNSMDCTLPTPEPVRKAVAVHPELLQKSAFNLPKSVAVSRIYYNPVNGTPTKMGRIVSSAANSSNMRHSANLSILNGSFRLCSPITSHCKIKKSADNFGCPTADSISCWQKVLTPVRTYTRKCNKPVMVRRPVLLNSAKKYLKYSRYKPTYLVNPTQAPNVTHQIELKKRKIIIDTKISISPRTFKKQQKQPVDEPPRKSTTLRPDSLSFHKPRPYLETMGMSAFDLLTNSNRNRIMSKKLNEQFRKSCVNKASSTYSKYKLLSTVPPLQQDEQVLEMSSMTLQNHKTE